MGRVINRFDISDPIRENEKIQIRSFFTEEHKSGFEKCKELNAEILIGCSGAFDTVADLIDKVDPGEKQRKIQEIGMEEFYRVYEKLLQSTHSQRLRMIGMDVVRVDLIVPAVILIEQLISVTGVGKIIQTDYALREGVLFEMINKS
jgi:exopolyphosphatase/guanosine-5'-triphosphate,3'-diphosphate pyrophosphatase